MAYALRLKAEFPVCAASVERDGPGQEAQAVPLSGTIIRKIRRHLHDGEAAGKPGLATRILGTVGEAYRHRIDQAPTAAVAPARVRPRATIAKEMTTSRARKSCSDMVAVLFLNSGAGVPVAVSELDDA